MTPRGFLCSIAIALLLLIAAADGDEIIVETSHATIEAQEGQRLRVGFAAEDRPALIFKPEARSQPAKKSGHNIPKNRCRTTVPERMVETLAELPLSGIRSSV